jgi:cytochrome bd-type quinol oxidase subunit 2
MNVACHPTVTTDRWWSSPRRLHRRLAVLMIVIAASLVVASVVHLTGHVEGRADLYDADDAGIAEAVIAVVLAAGAAVMLRVPSRARQAGLVATGFALAGFLVGISITARAGHWPDIAYHLAVLPLLVGGLITLYRAPGVSPTSAAVRQPAR